MAAAPELEQQGRLEAITSLCHALGFNGTSTEAWFAAWFADVECLRELAKQARSQRVQEVFSPESTVTREVLRMWMGYGRHDEERRPLVFTTDNGSCAAPDTHKTDVYSLCPPDLNDSPDLAKLWNSLALFWPSSKATAWRKASRAIDSCANYVTFGLHIGAYWDHAVFCLKLIAESGDGTWLTADMITLTTRDPIEMPLPSFNLLELRWVLDRIARLAGIEEKYGHEDWEENEDLDLNASTEKNKADAAATPLP